MDTIGKYQILERLGQGGMGIVYKALDPDIHREVAIKTIRNDLFAEGLDPEKILRQFMIEARAAGRLNHPNIATIYEVGRDKELTYIAMQYISGRSLRKVIESGVRFSPAEAIRLVRPVLQALDYAHRQGIVHRDIKPDNILIDKDGNPFLVDFGIATIESVNATRTRMTSATPAYMSPELILEGEVDHRTDLFSLGIILFELLAGRRPFGGENIPSLLNRIVNEAPGRLDPKDTRPPQGLEAVIRKALAKSPADRYATAAEMAAALEASVLDEERTTVLQEIKTTPPARLGAKKGWGFTPKDLLKNRRLILIMAGVTVCIGAAIVLFLTIFSPRPPEYEALVAIAPFEYKTDVLPKNLVEYALERSLAAATALPILSPVDRLAWERQAGTKSARRRPRLEIGGTIVPMVTGSEIRVTVSNRGKPTTRTFACKGPLDLITKQVDEILAFCAGVSDETIFRIAEKRSFAEICTANWDALNHFLRGQDAWNKLSSETAHAEFKSALENDPDFALARLRLAEVKMFRGDRAEARAESRTALAKTTRLIESDVLRIKALIARLDAKPSEERSYLMRLIEAFPFKKEYLYEFAESYFHSGDGSEAIPYYERALGLDPQYALAHNHLAFCYAWTGDQAEAETHLLEYVKLDHTANSYDSLASGYMFSGRLDKALEALEKGKALDARLDYLHGNFAVIYQLLGALGKSEASLKAQADVSTREDARHEISFRWAYNAWLRGDNALAESALRTLRNHYAGPDFRDSLDESSVLPFWLTGVIAAHQGQRARLQEMIRVLADKVSRKGVNATNYFPVFKFLLHLQALEAGLSRDSSLLLALIEEAERLKSKMGYWSSSFHLPYFLTEFAGILMESGVSAAKAATLLDEVLAYDPGFAPALLKRARLWAAEGKKDEAKKALAQARKSLSQADRDFNLFKELLGAEVSL